MNTPFSVFCDPCGSRLGYIVFKRLTIFQFVYYVYGMEWNGWYTHNIHICLLLHHDFSMCMDVYTTIHIVSFHDAFVFDYVSRI